MVNATPQPLFPPEKTQYLLHKRLSGPYGQSGRKRKISPALGLDPRTFKPVDSRYIIISFCTLKEFHRYSAGDNEEGVGQWHPQFYQHKERKVLVSGSSSSANIRNRKCLSVAPAVLPTYGMEGVCQWHPQFCQHKERNVFVSGTSSSANVQNGRCW
jgi:hypothetical protein